MTKMIRALGLFSLLLLGHGASAAEPPNAGACAQGMSLWSLIEAVNIGYADGRLQLGKMYALCLPQPATPSNSNFAYSPDAGGKLTTLVKDSSGQALTTYVWSAENILGLWEMSDYKVLGGEDSIKPLSAGAYTLEFQLEGKTFYRLPFSVATVPSDDPYQSPGTRYFIEPKSGG